jgi:hypothetical protein
VTTVRFDLAQFVRFTRNCGMRIWGKLWLVALIALGADVHAALAFDVSYWAWQREEPLSQEESAQLSAQNVHTVYWHVGELENSGESWRWKARFSFPHDGPIHFVPVVRLVSRDPQPFSIAANAALVRALTPTAKLTGELQLDYDAPDRLLDDYAQVLAKIHEVAPHLTITALPHWSRPDHLRSVSRNVDELFPMLYDFAAEPTLQNDTPLPLLAPEKMAQMLSDWTTSTKPWHAGLPTFARLTVYDAQGKSRGQIRNWNWDEVCLNDAFLCVSKLSMGATVLRARAALALSNTRLQKDDRLVVRLTDRTALREAILGAKQTCALGVIFFRLPDASASSGWSQVQLSHLDEKPHLVLRQTDSTDSLTLKNEGASDLGPGLESGKGEQLGYALEVAADSPIFREAETGDFASVAGYREAAEGLRRVAVPFATHLAYSFSQLRAKHTLKTGLIQLAPGASFHHVRYRFRNLSEEWNVIE